MIFKAITELIFLFVSVLIILGLRYFSFPNKLQLANRLIGIALVLAVISVFVEAQLKNYELIFSSIILGSILGIITSRKIKVDSFPQLQTFFWLVNGLSSAFLLFQVALEHPVMKYGIYGHVLYSILFSLFFTALIIANSGILLAKFSTLISDRPFHYPLKNTLNLLMFLILTFLAVFIIYKEDSNSTLLFFYFALSLTFGTLLFSTISKELNQVSFSLINLFAAINLFILGILFENFFVLIVSSLLFSTGIHLLLFINKYFNFTWKNLFISSKNNFYNLKSGELFPTSVEDIAIILENSQKILVFLGTELINSKAQHLWFEIASLLQQTGNEINYCIHPLASKIVGHLDLVLLDTNINYNDLVPFSQINAEIPSFDLILFLGASNILTLEDSEFKINLSKSKQILIFTENKIVNLKEEYFFRKVHFLAGNIKTNLIKLLSQIQKNLDL